MQREALAPDPRCPDRYDEYLGLYRRSLGRTQAERYVRQIEHDLTAAANGSRLIRPLDNIWRIKSGHHVCIFQKLPNDDIEVIRVLHERMDVAAALDFR